VKAYRGSATTTSVDMVNKLADKDNERAAAYPFLKQAFEDSINDFGPNDFFVLQKNAKGRLSKSPIEVCSLLAQAG
jgi:hypothetical protein